MIFIRKLVKNDLILELITAYFCVNLTFEGLIVLIKLIV